MADSDLDNEPRILNSFEKLDETTEILDAFLSVSVSVDPLPEENTTELKQLNKFTEILAEYQEQPYLLDPHLETLITPIIDVLRTHAKDFTSRSTTVFSSARVNRLSLLLYSFVKLRGYKTIVRFFPHEVSDLSVAINYMLLDGPVKEPRNWALRYLILLWLSLVCMLPFDLAQFDNDGNGSIASILEKIARTELDKAGLERDGAAFMLSKLYMRKDTLARLTSFLDLFEVEIHGSPRLFTCIGTLKALAEIVKSTPIGLLQTHLTHIQALVGEVSRVKLLDDNTVIRKLRTKLTSRIATRMLPLKSGRQRQTRKSLVQDTNYRFNAEDDEMEQDVPNEVENAFEELFVLLQDKDTSVRWSSAKGLSRICERLSTSFVDQVLDNILGFFTIHSSEGALVELPAAAEYPWHGASLACAELARRNLISDAHLPKVIGWMSKALFFDIQKGSFSVGSNVRDAAAYVLWSIARTRRKDLLEPYAVELAQKIVTVSLFDREIHIRRAASAAFQENVGRMGLFPHGIAILGKTDYYSVSIRRNAFLVAAPQVAAYEEYIQPILRHLLKVTLRHWDEPMRRLGAQSLRKTCEPNLLTLGPQMVKQSSELLLSVDTTVVHGGLLALGEIASAFRDAENSKLLVLHRRKIFNLLDSVPSTMILSPRNHHITEAACYIIANCVSSVETEELSGFSKDACWRTILAQGLRHRNSNVQEAAATAMGSLSQLIDCSERSSPNIQQSLARVLGPLDYLSHSNGFASALVCLLESVDPLSVNYFKDVEARRNVYASLSLIVVRLSPRLNEFVRPDTMKNIFDVFFTGLEDYTVNERGDVGSWVRLACARGLCSMSQALIGQAGGWQSSASKTWSTDSSSFDQYLPLETYHKAVGSILKQGVERLDNVRQCVGELFMLLLEQPHPTIEWGEKWTVRERAFFIDILKVTDSPGWNDGSWLYPRAVLFLNVELYRLPVLRGIVLSIGSKTNSIQRPASTAILSYSHTLPPTGETNVSNRAYTYSVNALVTDLLNIAQENSTSNNAVVPVLQTFNILLEGDALLSLALADDRQCTEILMKLLDLAIKNVGQLKSVQRVEESMKVVVNTLSLPLTRPRTKAIVALRLFLQHRFPKIRADSAETLYVVLQTKDIEYDDNVEKLLLETEWSTDDCASLIEPTALIISYLGSEAHE